MILAWDIQPTEGIVARTLIDKTQEVIPGCWPLWVSDGWDPYGEALFEGHSIWVSLPKTGKPGRPKGPKPFPHPSLRYGQAVKVRNEHNRVTGVKPKVVFGKVRRSEITTWCIERQNLNFRHENRRLSRKTIAFSKTIDGLRHQLSFYQGYFNFIRPHWGLRIKLNNPGSRKWQRLTPAMAARISGHPWTMKEFLCCKIPLN